MARLGTGSDDDVLRRDRFLRSGFFTGADFDRVVVPCRDKFAKTFQPRDFVLPKQKLDAFRHLGDDAIFARLHLRNIDLHASRGDAVLTEFVFDLFDIFGRLQQRLRRNATDVQASTAQRHFAFGILPALDAGDIKSQLRRTNRGNVAAWTGADNDNIKLFGHSKTSFLTQPHARNMHAQRRAEAGD